MAIKSLRKLLVFAALSAFQHVYAGEVAQGVSEDGPYSFESAEYKLPAMIDDRVLANVATELWARVWLPKDGREALPTRQRPLVVFLHGNHGTCGKGKNPRVDNDCSYTKYGTCPNGYEVVPNHMGYEYAAEKLASWGYAVASINANRGITCGSGPSSDWGLNLARGKLVLRHLETLSKWNQDGVDAKTLNLDMEDRLDFNHVGLVGHSRGGEGVRAAYNIYFEDPYWFKNIGLVQFKGIFEIGPVDGQTSRVLNAPLTAWNVLLPMCDGDVSDLQGVKVFDRMLNFTSEHPMRTKSVYMVWGTNHNFYNTEWQQSDSRGCSGHTPLWSNSNGKAEQMFVGATAMLNFFNTYLSLDSVPAPALEFDPFYDSMKEISSKTRVDKEFVHTTNNDVTLTIEDFNSSKGHWGVAPTSSTGVNGSIKSLQFHDSSRKGAQIEWQKASDQQFLEVALAKPGEFQDASRFRTLDFSVSRSSAMVNVRDATDFSIQLVDQDDQSSKMLSLSDYHNLIGPVGTGSGGWRPLLHTVRIALDDFSGFDLSKFRAVRFVFNKSPNGSILLDQIRLSALVSGEKTLADFDTYAPDIDPANFASLVRKLSAPTSPSGSAPSTSSSVEFTLTDDARSLLTSFAAKVTLVHMENIERKDEPFSGKALKDLLLPYLKLDAAATEVVKLTYSRDDGETFTPRGQLLNLTICGRTFHQSSFADDGSLKEVSFYIPKKNFNSIPNGVESTIHYGDYTTATQRFFVGSLNKKLVRDQN